jgi:hypothetical protein
MENYWNCKNDLFTTLFDPIAIPPAILTSPDILAPGPMYTLSPISVISYLWGVAILMANINTRVNYTVFPDFSGTADDGSVIMDYCQSWTKHVDWNSDI